jgi:hypothetical protein
MKDDRQSMGPEEYFNAGGASVLATWLGQGLDLLAKELHGLHLERDRDNVSRAALEVRLIAERLQALDPGLERARRELTEQRVLMRKLNGPLCLHPACAGHDECQHPNVGSGGA